MQYRAFGRAGFSVSEIGFGAWGIGGATPGPTSYGHTDDVQSLAALRAARDAGITFFDTSAVYGYGHSEELIGAAFEGCRHEVVIATKAGLSEYGKPADFDVTALECSLNASLARLRTDYVDLFQLHNPPLEVIEAQDALAALVERLKRQGRIRAFGVSVRTPQDGMAAIRHLRPEALQINLNLLDQRAIDIGLMDAAGCEGVAVIGRTPLSFGFLSGAVTRTTEFAADDHRSRWPRAQIQRWIEGADELYACRARAADTRAEFALRFCLSVPGLTSIIPGMLSPAEVAANVRASQLGPLSAAEFDAVRAIARSTDYFVAAEAHRQDPGKQDKIISVAYNGK